MRIKKMIYAFVIRMIWCDREQLLLTNKQKSQIESLIFKLENM